MCYSQALVLFFVCSADFILKVSSGSDFSYDQVSGQRFQAWEPLDKEPSLLHDVKRYIHRQYLKRNYHEYMKNMHLGLINPRYKRFLGPDDGANRATETTPHIIPSTPPSTPMDPALITTVPPTTTTTAQTVLTTPTVTRSTIKMVDQTTDGDTNMAETTVNTNGTTHGNSSTMIYNCNIFVMLAGTLLMVLYAY